MHEQMYRARFINQHVVDSPNCDANETRLFTFRDNKSHVHGLVTNTVVVLETKSIFRSREISTIGRSIVPNIF